MHVPGHHSYFGKRFPDVAKPFVVSISCTMSYIATLKQNKIIYEIEENNNIDLKNLLRCNISLAAMRENLSSGFPSTAISATATTLSVIIKAAVQTTQYRS